MDQTELLRRIEQNTANTYKWMQITGIAVIILVVVTIALFI